MVTRRNVWLFAAALLLLSVAAGCKRSDLEAPEPTAVPVEQPQLLARLHWIGLERLRQDTNAAYLAKILELPESLKIGEDLLQKFSRAPWTLAAGLTNSAAASNDASGLLLSLLRTLAANEVCLEIHEPTNEPASLALAVKLDPAGAALWASNSAAIVAALPGASDPGNAGPQNTWRIPTGSHTNYLQIQTARDWTIIGFGHITNSALQDFVSRVQRGNDPARWAGTNRWLEVHCDLARLLPALSPALTLPVPAPQLDLSASGDGEHIKVQGELTFPKPLHLDTEPWLIPTNMVREPLVSFGACQGFGSWLKTLKWIQDLQITNVPNQLVTWSIGLTPVHVFAAAPLPDASAVIDRVGPDLEKMINSWLTNHASEKAEFSPPNHGIAWVPVPLLTPTFQALPGVGGGLLFGRLASTLPPPGKTAPPELLNRVTSRTNLIYYDWEITETRLKQWVFLAQSLRIAFHRAQLPSECDSFAFLKAISPKLGNTVTEVTRTGPATLSFVRKSHIGFTGVELHLLADWFESPTFPRGLYSDLPSNYGALRWNAKTKTLEPAGKNPPPRLGP